MEVGAGRQTRLSALMRTRGVVRVGGDGGFIVDCLSLKLAPSLDGSRGWSNSFCGPTTNVKYLKRVAAGDYIVQKWVVKTFIVGFLSRACTLGRGGVHHHREVAPALCPWHGPFLSQKCFKSVELFPLVEGLPANKDTVREGVLGS